MSPHRRRVSRHTPPARQLSLWPLGDSRASEAPAQLPGAGAEPPDDDTASPPHVRTPSFVCEIPLRVSPADERVLAHGLAAPVKYVRLVRRRINGRPRFWVQLVCAGKPYQKAEHTLGMGTVGLDLGPSTVAMVAGTTARRQPFCAELDPQAAQIRREQRHLDRQRRANNPDNYEPDGRSIQRRAPGMLVQRLTRLAESAGGQVHLIPTRPTKLSQTCQCGSIKKKPLAQRVHTCEQCGLQMQRDLYSAYLIRLVDPDTFLLHADQARKSWPGWEPILRAAWQQAIPTFQPASGGASGVSHVRRQRAGVRRSRSSAASLPANPKSLDAVPSGRARQRGR